MGIDNRLHNFQTIIHFASIVSMGVARIIFRGEEFQKIFKNFIKKIAKTHYFSIWKFEKNFENFSKNFLKNREKCIILEDFSKSLTNPALHYCAFGRKTQFIGNVEKIFKDFLMKFVKNALFYNIFQGKLTNHELHFCAFWRQTEIVWKLWEIFENLQKPSKNALF